MKVAAGLVRAAHTEHMILTQRVYGTNHIKPKAHWMYDIADQIQEWEEVADSYPIERNHTFVKSIAEHIDRTATYETSLLSGVTTKHRQQLNEGHVHNCLIGRSSPVPGYPAEYANRLSCNGLVISVKDFVLLGRRSMGEVVAAIQHVNGLFILVEVWEPCGDHLPHSKRYRPKGTRECWPAEALEQSVAWYFSDDLRYVTVLTY